MKSTITTCLLVLLTVVASGTYAIDLGDILNKTKQEQQAAPTTQQEQNQQTLSKEEGLNLFGEVSLADEVGIGRQVAGNLLGAAPLVKDDKLQKYVNSVGRWVALQSDRPDLEWHFSVIDSTDINAFAVPGGYVMVTKGLYQTLNSEAELAGVLAHEIGHVVRKHHLKLMKQGQLLEIGSKLLSQKVATKDEAIKKFIGSGAELFARSLDKNAEYEADRVAVVLATRAGYDSYGLPTVLQEIGQAGADESRVSLLFKTHPHPDNRLVKLGDAMGTAFDSYKGKTVAERFYRIKK